MYVIDAPRRILKQNTSDGKLVIHVYNYLPTGEGGFEMFKTKPTVLFSNYLYI